MAKLLQNNVHDHLADAALNLKGGHNYLEQSVFLKRFSDESTCRLHIVMTGAQARCDHDQQHTSPETHIHGAGQLPLCGRQR